MECLTCKKHFSQGGYCCKNKYNCLWYDEEPRGRMIRTNINFEIVSGVETPIIRPGENVIIDDSGQEIEMGILRINWINLDTMLCNVSVCYHESESPRFERKKMFKIVK